MSTARTPQEILAHHASALRNGDLGEVLKDFDESSVLITLDRTYRGRNEIGDFYAWLMASLPNAVWTAKRVFEHNTLLVQWTAKSDRFTVNDGIDTFIFRDGMISVQTVRATVLETE